MDKLTAIKIKYDDGTYSDEIPVSVLSENVEWDSTHTLVDVLGSIDVDVTGTIQDQISQLFNEKVSNSDMQSYVSSSMPTYITTWLNTNVNPVGSAVVVDKSLTVEGAAADAKEVGNKIANLKEDLDNLDDKILIDYSDNLYANPMVGVRTQSSGTQLVRYNNNKTNLTARIPVSPNTAYSVTFSELTDYAVLVTSSQEVTQESFDTTNPITLANSNVISTSRQTVYNFTTDANARYLYICSTITGNMNAYIYVCHGTVSSVVLPTAWVKYLDTYRKSEIDTMVEPLTETERAVACIFNGTTSVCTISKIELQNEGDSLEIKVTPNSTANQGWSFANHSNFYRIALAATSSSIGVRSVDNTWLCPNTTFDVKDSYVLKVLYQDGNVLTYVDEELIYTYTGQKRFVIESFGHNIYYNNWQGSVGYIKVNGVKYSDISQLPQFVGTDVQIVYPYGWLTEEQNEKLNSFGTKKMTIKPSFNKVSVYFYIHDNTYGKIDIVHESNHADNPYIDYWRIADSSISTSSDGITFIDSNNKLLVGAENEMAIAFEGMEDFTGGWHGDERIDLDNNCYVKFILNGAEYDINTLVALGTVQCEEFSYREVSQLFASYSYNANHLPIAKHTKITKFTDKGFVTTNYIGMDLSSFDRETLKLITAFTGLFCIATPFATTAVSDTGDEYTGTHPTTTVTLAEEMNTYSLRAKTYNGKRACEIDSRLLRTNVDAINNPPIDVDIMDRQNDLKYYSYLPSNALLQTGDYLATEGTISWHIKS